MKPTCRIVQSLAPSRDGGAFTARLDSHLNACLGCQAELARYGRLRRQLASLADEVVEAPQPLAGAVAAAISSGSAASAEKGIAHPARVAAAAGAVVAAAAGAVAVAVWRHSRPAVR